MNSRGMALAMVLGTLLVVVILANVILAIISSQTRLTHHQVSRIQAYYAAQAGINYALEKLRLGNDPDWPLRGGYSRKLCRSSCDINDPDLPASIKEVNIIVGEPGSGISNTSTVSATVNYTYTP